MKTRFTHNLPLLALSAILLSIPAGAQDTDQDLLSDAEETLIGSDPFDTDTDGDGILDRAEIYPYQIIPGTFTFQQALEDAVERGGRLAVIDSPKKLIEVKRGLLTTALPAPLPNNFDPTVTLADTLWVGGHDSLVDGRYQWIAPKSVLHTPTEALDGPHIGSAAFGDLVPDSNQITNVVNVNSMVLGRDLVASGIPSGTTITAIDTTARTLTLSNAVEGTLSRRISEIVVTNPGFGYTIAPDVVLTGGAPGISTITITNQGTGYTTAPSVTFTGGTPTTAATGVATISGGKVTGVTITSRGSGYTSAPSISFGGGGGSGATATVSLGNAPTAVASLTSDNKVNAITVTNDGNTFYTTAPTVAIVGGNGGGATATAALTPAANASLATIKIDNPGSGYTTTPTVNITGGGGSGASAVASINSAGVVTGIAIINPGSGFTFPPLVTFSGGLGVVSINVTNGGTGYTTPPTVTLTGGGTGATATATVSGGSVTGVTITNRGTNYTTIPTVSFGGPGTGATATATITTPAEVTATIKVSSGRIYSPAPDAYSNWTVNLPGNRNDSQEGVFLNTGGLFTWGTATVGTTRGYLLELPVTSPIKADTDSDGIADDEELVSAPPTNPTLADTDVDGLSDSEELTFGSDPTLADTDDDSLGDLQERNLGTSPILADTDGDGLTDGEEFNSSPSSDPLLVDTDGEGLTDAEEKTAGSNPTVVDTDLDKLTDFDEVKIYNTNPLKKDSDSDGLDDFYEIFTSKTNPLLADTDGDSLTDSEEVNGTFGFTSDPLLVDTDGDLVSDAVEVKSTPPTNPRDGTRVPPGVVPTLSDLHTVASKSLPDRVVSIDSSFAPFGHRPDTDKSGEDGSVAIRDRNGAIIWVDSLGNGVVVPNSSLARTLYVTNTECVLYNNRYDGTFNARGSESQIVMYRRQEDGTLLAAPTITIDQTIVETAPITPVTFGFTIIAGAAAEDGIESRERYQSGTTDAGPVYDVRDVDFWDVRSYSMYQITWDGNLQSRGGTIISVPNNSPNTGEFILGTGSDGSFVFTTTVARNFYADRPEGGFFEAESVDFWVTWNLNAENIRRLQPSGYPASIDLGYISNSKLIIEYDEVLVGPPNANGLPTFIPTGNFELFDFRQRPNGVSSIANVFPLDPGYTILPASAYTRSGTEAFIYAISDARTNVQLLLAGTTLAKVGAAVDLPGPVLADTAIVRNPSDASLLMKSEGDVGVIWVPSVVGATSGIVSGFGTPRKLDNTSLGLPLFVNSKEAVVWVNNGAQVDLGNGGVVPTADIKHYQMNSTGVTVSTPLTPPIEGRWVALPFALSPDADTEGWYITTFEKTAPRDATIRTYRLQLSSTADRDADGLSDYLEISLGTDPGNPDSDSDGISDGDEVWPYNVVTGSFTWEQARTDARLKGGRLLVPSNSTKQVSVNSKLGRAIRFAGAPLWIGGHDQVAEKQYQWLSYSGTLKGPLVSYSNWSTFQPDNVGDADGMEMRANTGLTWSMATVSKRQGYIVEYLPTDPLKADTDGDGLTDGDERLITSNPTKADTDGDGLTDKQERTYRTDPLKKDTDSDGLTDGVEVNRYKTNPVKADTDADGLDDGTEVTLGTDPRRKDTDGDGLLDGDEVKLRTNPLSRDTDGDGLTDGREVKLKTDPLKKDTDGDGVSDFDEVSKGTDPLDKRSPKGVDTDGDGLTDYEELFIHNTNPKDRDTDGDGLSDKYEVGRGTNPLVADTDGDGVNDYDEIFVLNTNPNNPSFGNPSSPDRIPFGSNSVKGDYEGIVYGGKSGLSFRQRLRLSADGSFSTSLSGLRSSGSFRGKFSSNGIYAAPVGVIPGVTYVEMSVVKRAGSYVIQGTYLTRSGGKLYFELRSEGYKGPKSYGWKSRLTFDASRVGTARGPQGSAVATGDVRSDGKVAFRIYMPDGSRSSFTGPLLDGNFIAFYTKSSASAPSVMLGSVSFNAVKNVSDFSGSLRLFNAGGVNGSLFPSGFDQRRSMVGSRYYKPAGGTLPIGNFKVTNNNSVFEWRTGNFSGISKVGTWTTDGRIVVPSTQNDSLDAKFETRTGLLSVKYTRTDASRDMNGAVSKGHAVILQKRKTFRGYYGSDRSAGDFRVEPNDDGQQPDVTTVSPSSKSVAAAATTYTVSVTTKGTWSVAIPADATWITATVSSASGPTGPSATTQGSGNGSVTITVAQNTTNTRREANVTIAGFNHLVKQEFR